MLPKEPKNSSPEKKTPPLIGVGLKFEKVWCDISKLVSTLELSDFVPVTNNSLPLRKNPNYNELI